MSAVRSSSASADQEPGLHFEDIQQQIADKRLEIGIVGLGSVGLPLAHLEPGHVRELVESGRFLATSDPERLGSVHAALVCVPTPLTATREPDLSCVEQATRTLAASLPRGALVVLESTSYPGTTRNVLGAIFERAGWRIDEDVWLAYSPEREDPGRGLQTAQIPKLVGGTSPRSGDLAQALYERAVAHVRRVSSAEVAEAAKLHENIFRAVNIALVNELKVALDAMGIDVWETIDAASTKPFGFMKFTPGPGMGGHCIPVDPFYLSWIARQHGVETRFVELAGRINREMPGYVVERTRLALAAHGKALAGARVLVLGLAYKPDVDIVTESPSIRLIELFEAEGCDVRYSDPCVHLSPARGPRDACSGEDPMRIASIARGGVPCDRASLASFDVVVLATHHTRFDYELIASAARLVVDTRHALAERMHGDPRYFSA